MFSYQTVAKYQRVGRHALNSTRLRINGTYKQKISLRRQRICRYKQTNTCRQRQQAGASIDLSTAIELGKKVGGSSVGKMIIIDAINARPTAYRTLKAKWQIKKAKTILNTGIVDYIVKKGVNYLGERIS